jgi:hypothetical protein
VRAEPGSRARLLAALAIAGIGCRQGPHALADDAPRASGVDVGGGAGASAASHGAPPERAAAKQPALATSEPARECCMGKNPCAGKGGCAVPENHDCAGKNACEGQGGCRGHCPK